jgi:hemoglobin
MEVLDEAGMPDDEPFRQVFRQHVEFGARVSQQNSRAETDADVFPLHEVPHWSWSGEA